MIDFSDIKNSNQNTSNYYKFQPGDSNLINIDFIKPAYPIDNFGNLDMKNIVKNTDATKTSDKSNSFKNIIINIQPAKDVYDFEDIINNPKNDIEMKPIEKFVVNFGQQEEIEVK